MNEEERLTLNNYIEDLYQAMQIGDIVFEPKNSSELYNLINKLLQENEQLKENYECILKQRDDLTKNATQQIESLIDEKNKYKSLYENEKEHTDTLKRIIKEVKEYLEGTFEMSIYTKSVYLDEESIEEILDLLKEIK